MNSVKSYYLINNDSLNSNINDTIMKKYLLMLFCLAISMFAMAQQKTVTIKVIDTNNESVIGASVLEKGLPMERLLIWMESVRSLFQRRLR